MFTIKLKAYSTDPNDPPETIPSLFRSRPIVQVSPGRTEGFRLVDKYIQNQELHLMAYLDSDYARLTTIPRR